jgi:AraC family transcriptional regulator of adaptative response / DNA-3-methyladenine glycosylase II
LSGDVALHSALGLRQAKSPALEAQTVAQAWQPWRSYGVIRAWHSQSNPKAPPHAPHPA